MNKYKQVFPAGRGAFTFRLMLPAGHKFQCEESWETQEQAAFYADLLKFYITKKFGLKSSSLRPSLPLAVFFSMLRDAGIPKDKLEDIFNYALSFSTREMLLNGVHQLLTEYAANQKAGWDEPPCAT